MQMKIDRIASLQLKKFCVVLFGNLVFNDFPNIMFQLKKTSWPSLFTFERQSSDHHRDKNLLVKKQIF